MGDEHLRIVKALDLGRHPVDQRLNGRFPAPGLAHGHQVAGIVDVEDRFDVDQGAHDGGGFGDPAAPVQMVEIIHREVVDDVPLDGLDVFCGLGEALARVPVLDGLVDQQSMAQRGAQGVDHDDVPLREFLPGLFRGDESRAAGAGKTGRKSDVQQVVPLGQDPAEQIQGILQIGGGGGGQGAAPEFFVKSADVHVLVGHAVHGYRQREHGNLMLPAVARWKIGTGIGADDK